MYLVDLQACHSWRRQFSNYHIRHMGVLEEIKEGMITFKVNPTHFPIFISRVFVAPPG